MDLTLELATGSIDLVLPWGRLLPALACHRLILGCLAQQVLIQLLAHPDHAVQQCSGMQLYLSIRRHILLYYREAATFVQAEQGPI